MPRPYSRMVPCPDCGGDAEAYCGRCFTAGEVEVFDGTVRWTAQEGDEVSDSEGAGALRNVRARPTDG